MTTREILIAARERIRRGWTQGVSARNVDGDLVPWDSPHAICWCALGAIWAEATYTIAAEFALEDAVGRPAIAAWNDAPGRTQKEVIQAFDEAIAACGEQES